MVEQVYVVVAGVFLEQRALSALSPPISPSRPPSDPLQQRDLSALSAPLHISRPLDRALREGTSLKTFAEESEFLAVKWLVVLT